MEPKIRISILGNPATAEMQPVKNVLNQICCPADIRVFDSPDELLNLASDGWFPDLVLVCQNWPEEFTHSEIQTLLAAFPLARWICCFGAWCEADGRSHSFWPEAIRVSARCCAHRIRHEWKVLSKGADPLPLTAGRDEKFDYDCMSVGLGESLRLGQRGVTIAIFSPDRCYAEFLRDLLQSEGCESVAIDEGQISDVAVWDVDPWNEQTAAHLQALKKSHPQSKILAVMSMAHPETIAELKSKLADEVLPKLASNDDLVLAVSRLADHSECRSL